MTGDFFFHYTSFEGFKGILCGHEHNDLCFHLSHSQDMNDNKEITLGNRVVENICSRFPNLPLIPQRATSIDNCFILSLSEKINFSQMEHKYGPIALKMERQNNRLLNDVSFDECIYVTSDSLLDIEEKYIEKIQMCLDSTVLSSKMNLFDYSWELILLPFYLKSKEKWSGENEWRVVENAQDGQVVYQKINSKGKKIRYIERTMNHNTLKGVFISKSVSIEQEKEINEILSSLSYSFKAKRVE